MAEYISFVAPADTHGDNFGDPKIPQPAVDVQWIHVVLDDCAHSDLLSSPLKYA
jgi:hypothetical protein